MTMNDVYTRIKSLVLAGMSGYAACRRLGEDPLKWSKQLSRDPDIVKAKVDGDIRELGRKKPDRHYVEMPWVVDVMVNGMTQTAAAAKYGKPQPYVSLCVKRAKEVLAKDQEAPTPTTTPTPTTQDLDILEDIMRAYAKRLGMRPEALAHDMIHRLAD